MKSILITGGTGSFGRALLRNFLEKGVHEVRILSRDEEKQAEIRNSLRDERVRYFIGDIRDRDAVESAVRGVDAVVHAAALKQVPSCEFFPHEAVRTNILGSENVIRASIAAGVEALICISTDKAVFPVNAMGMSKALMEKLVLASARELGSESNTKLSCIRYGNVMYSRGSVIPHFIKQINSGRSITVTDPSMTRFMLPLRDGIDALSEVLARINQGELLVKKAPAAKILDLTAALLELFDAPDHPIEIIGRRHGEKRHETLASAQELIDSKDSGGFYRIGLDQRHLDDNSNISEHEILTDASQEYNSNNTERLSVDGIKALLLTLPEVKEEILVRKNAR